MAQSQTLIDTLRASIRLLERAHPHANTILPFGIVPIDSHLPQGGLQRGSLHDISGGGADAEPAACAALFAAGILARLNQSILWCSKSADIFGPGLAAAGLLPDHVLHAHTKDDTTMLLVMEEALRHRDLAAVVGELHRLPMTASRRLVLAAEKSGVMAIALRRSPAETAASTAAATRWRISPVPGPSAGGQAPSPGLSRARWHVELVRCRGAEAQGWVMEACDAQGYLSVPAELADRSVAFEGRLRA